MCGARGVELSICAVGREASLYVFNGTYGRFGRRDTRSIFCDLIMRLGWQLHPFQQNWQTDARADQGDDDDAGGEKDSEIARRERRAVFEQERKRQDAGQRDGAADARERRGT